MTNYDRIKAMSIEKMATFLKDIYNCPCKFCGLYDDADCAGKCEQGHIKWLKQEVSE